MLIVTSDYFEIYGRIFGGKALTIIISMGNPALSVFVPFISIDSPFVSLAAPLKHVHMYSTYTYNCRDGYIVYIPHLAYTIFHNYL